MHAVKIERSHKLAPHLPSAQAEIDNSISPVLIERLTAAELAEVRRCLDRHWHKARAFEVRQILEEGCIWDESRQKLREIAD